MKQFSVLASIFLLGVITLASCEKDEPEVCATWDADVKAIIELSCSYEGCHSGGATANTFIAAGSNDYTTYAGIKGNLDSGAFVQRALTDKNMPPAMFVQPGNPTELTQAQLDILQCWADAGFPEN